MILSQAILKAKAELSSMYEAGELAAILDIAFMQVMQMNKLQLRINLEKEVDENQLNQIVMIISALKNKKPIQYILGETTFYGLVFKVNDAVLIPRPETEELVLKALNWIGKKRLRVLEIGSGSGCIAIALKKNAPNIEIVSVDISANAITTAKENAIINNVTVDFKQLDFLDIKNWMALGTFDVIISNPPYILEAEKSLMEPHVLEYEPHMALFVNNGDAQQFYRAIALFAQQNIEDIQAIFLELNQQFATDTQQLFEQQNWQVQLQQDLNNNDRILICLR